MVPRTSDGRVMFAIPWHGAALIGTTDTPISDVSLEPLPLPEEIDFLLETASQYLRKAPSRENVLSMFAGIRPLVKAGEGKNTAALARDHNIHISSSGLLSVMGGKWTTYRKMAEDCVDQASTLAGLETRPCVTQQLNIHGYHRSAAKFGDLKLYGADAPAVADLLRAEPALDEKLHPALTARAGEVIWAARSEMARTVDDFLARRTRALILNARAAIETAPRVAALLAKELGRDQQWQAAQVEAFARIADNYMPR
jgi:glycerol-3-phosphate dehydrogenase